MYSGELAEFGNLVDWGDMGAVVSFGVQSMDVLIPPNAEIQVERDFFRSRFNNSPLHVDSRFRDSNCDSSGTS